MSDVRSLLFGFSNFLFSKLDNLVEAIGLLVDHERGKKKGTKKVRHAHQRSRRRVGNTRHLVCGFYFSRLFSCLSLQHGNLLLMFISYRKGEGGMFWHRIEWWLVPS